MGFQETSVDLRWDKVSERKELFDENIKRVESLVALYVQLKEDKQRDRKEYKLTDILRAAVVFLHSAFEEYFRSILIEWLPLRATSETLKQFPIAAKAGKKAEKILLNDLIDFRGKSVDDIIYESVAETMKLRSFNSEEDIRNWCCKINISIEDTSSIQKIGNAVQRRHKIVHEADLNKNEKTEKTRLTLIKPADVTAWIEEYKKFVNQIEKQSMNWKKEGQDALNNTSD